MKTLGIEQAIADHAEKQPEKEALVVGDLSLSYSELWRGIKSAAAALSPYEGGVLLQPAEKRVEFVFHYFGAHMAGVANLLIDPKISEAALGAVVGVLPPTCSLALQVDQCPALPVMDWELGISHEVQEIAFPKPDRVADYMFTTGTTGRPKCVPLSNGNLAASANNINTFIGNTDKDRELLALPLCHSFGLGRLRCQFLAGGTAVLIPNFGNERKVLKLLQRDNITGFAMVPAAWMYLKHLCEAKLAIAGRRLHYIEFGSASLPIEEKRRLMQLFPRTRLCMHYGLTEASRSTFIEFHSEEKHLDTVGKASPNTKIIICGDNGSRQRIGELGEVCIGGEHVTPGYLNKPNAECFFGEYFRTGDQGYIDTEGYVHLTSRLKELINVGGKKVSPDEVDTVLMRYPGVKECACVAAQDPAGILGEVVKAWIVLEEGVQKPSDDALTMFLRRHLETYKIPRMFSYRTEPLPRTSSGKLLRGELRE